MELDSGHSLIIADIPGLIEGASQGKGLGIRFLKHIERTQLLLHVLDATYRPSGDMLEDLHMIRDEMAEYSAALIEKPYMVLINKIDLVNDISRDLDELQRVLKEENLFSLRISALTGEGIDVLKAELSNYFKENMKNSALT